MRRRTKIVCTLGPAVDSRAAIQSLIDAGMSVARLNCSHGTWEQKDRWIGWIRELMTPDHPIAILADLQGPKFRVGSLPPAGLELRTGEIVALGRGAGIPIDQEEILSAITPNARLLLGDGEIELKIISGEDGVFRARVVTGGILKSHKGVTLVDKIFDVPALTDKDKSDVAEACSRQVDFIALSYVKHADDLRELRALVNEQDRTIGLVAKLETREAIKELDEILTACDVAMVARGDMGLQMDIEEVPLMQKRIIDRCRWAGIPVITATQMLESMISNPRPTRAEATDVFNAILDGTDAVMLSGETASGQYPTECVRTMARLAESAEAVYDRAKLELTWEKHSRHGVEHTDGIAHAVSQLARLLKVSAIITTSTSGQTPRLVSKFRPKAPILCATWSPRTLAKMCVVWGVEGILVAPPTTTEETVDNAIQQFVQRNRLKVGDQVVITAGTPPGVPGRTNLIMTKIVQ